MKKFLIISKNLTTSLLLTLPLYSPIAHSSPSTTGEGNLVTGTNGVATGYNNTVTASNGLAQGNNSVATGDNKTRDEFKETVEANKQAIADKTAAEKEVSNIETKIEVNKKTQESLSNKIDELTKIINQTGNKTDQINSLKDELRTEENKLTELKNALEVAKRNATSTSGTGDKTIWINFEDQLAKLNWNKLTDDSGGTSGYYKVAKELKDKVDENYPEFLTKWEVEKYENIVHGYLNARAEYGNSKNEIYKSLREKQFNYLYANGSDDSKITDYPNEYDGIIPLLKSVTSVSPIEMNSMPSRISDKFFSYDKLGNYTAYTTILNIVNKDNVISNLNKSYNLKKFHYHTNIAGNTENIVFYLPPAKRNNNDDKNYSRFLATNYTSPYDNRNYYGYYRTSEFINKIFNGKEVNSVQNIDYLREWVGNFNEFYLSIDKNASEEQWLFNKEKFFGELNKVKGFVDKINDYITAYDETIKHPDNTENKLKLINLYHEIKGKKDNPKNYYENIEFEFKPETIKLWNKYAKETAKELTDSAKKLKLYDPYNEIIQGIANAAKNAKDAVDNAQKAVEEKQKEIDNITKQIDNLALTDDEKNAVKLKEEKEKELADKRAEKAELEKDKEKKEEALKALEEKLKELDIAKLKGENAIASGTNAFASGKNAIAIGTNATAQNENAIAIGSENTVTAANSVAIGSNNTVLSNNVMVLGNNVTVNKGFDGAVVLGDKSIPSKPTPVENITIQGTTYAFAGIDPKSTVSVGKAGEERQITNVAAGRISNISTDAINGSQLYSVIEILKKLQANTPNPTGSTTGGTTGGTTGSATGDTTGGTTGGSTGGSGTIPSIGNVNISGDNKNISVTGGTGNFTVKLNDDISLNKVKTGYVSFSKDGINAGHKIVSNVADGKVTKTSTDAVNGSQLYSVKQESAATNQRIDALTQKVNKDNKMLKAGIAGTAAIAGLPQVRGNGKAMVSAGVGNFKGQNAIAVGYSRSSDNGKVLFRLSGSANTQGDVVSSVGVGYEW